MRAIDLLNFLNSLTDEQKQQEVVVFDVKNNCLNMIDKVCEETYSYDQDVNVIEIKAFEQKVF